MFDNKCLILYNRDDILREDGDFLKHTGSNVNTIKAENNSLILNHIRQRAMSRAEISKITGLSKSSVTTITKQLIDEGSLIEIGTESISYGRHPILLDIVKNHRYAMGIFLNRVEANVCIVNLKLECCGSKSIDINNFDSPEKVFEWAYTAGLSIMKEQGISEELCIGIGVASPGPIDYKKGFILTPPNFRLFHNFDVTKYFSKITDFPVFVNNVPVLMAMYEHCKRPLKIDNYLFIAVDNGVGSAIIQKGNVYRGSAGFSGELGHTTIDINGPLCSCGNRGCFENYITKNAIKKKYDLSSYKQLIDEAFDNEQEAIGIVDEIANCFSSGIVNAINLFDLDAVIIFGELNYRYELLFEKIQFEINNRSIITKAHPVKVLPSIITTESKNAFSATNVIDRYFMQML